jgi:translation elongation factor EF-1beta
MTNEIIIDISKINKTEIYGNESEYFQKNAFNKMSELLQYEISRSDFSKGYDLIQKTRRHDSIFIDGPRGSGKTVFLLNIENYFKKYNGVASEQYYFFNPIDPTLLIDNEDFLGVILGMVVQELSNKNYLQGCNQENLIAYYKALENLSNSLIAVKEILNNELKGIDEIASFKSSNSLEEFTNKFFFEVFKLLGNKKLVLLIDDIDMAFSKGFDVLETIRKFLSTPYILPIVSGDGRLYKEIIAREFRYKLSRQKSTEKNRNEFEDLNNLVEQYFNKVLPNDNRIQLENMQTILKNNKIKIKLASGSNINFEKIKEFEEKTIFYGINQKQFIENIFKYNVRSFVQYLAKKSSLYEDLSKEFSKKSLEFTADFYRFVDKSEDKDKARLSKMLENDISACVNDKLNIYEIFKGDFFQNESYTKDADSETYLLKLDKEYLQRDLYIVRDSGENQGSIIDYLNDEKGIKYIIPRLFTHQDYYTAGTSTRFYIFSGKFVEFMMFCCSFDEFQNIDEPQKKSTLKDKLYPDSNENNYDKFQEKINEIINTSPYNTSIKNNYLIENTEEDGKNDDNYKTILADSDNEIIEELKNWYLKYNQYIKIGTISLHHILNKFFNNINVIKGLSLSEKRQGLNVQTMIKNGETPIGYFKRIVVVFLNAIASIEKNGIISNENIANSDRKFDYETIKEKSNTFKNNIKSLLESDTPNTTQAFYNNPIIQTILNMADEQRLRFPKNSQNLEEKYKRYRSKNYKKIDEISSEYATKYYNGLIKEGLLSIYEKRRDSRGIDFEKKIEELKNK